MKKVYYIVTSLIDEQTGEIDFINNKEFEDYPSEEEIEGALRESNGTQARVEKRYVLY